jgi:predicted transcriptional regulator of viral defense system
VTQQKISDRTELRVTDVERTLIDIVVRPVYSGGVFEIANAFHEAAGKYSVNRLCAYLRQLNFTYPYHQAIGFYMARSGRYKKSQLDLLRQFPMDFDFYLAHGMRQKQYIGDWKLYIPEGVKLDT